VLVAVLHASYEPNELSQWQYHDDRPGPYRSVISLYSYVCLVVSRWTYAYHQMAVGLIPGRDTIKWFLLLWVTVCGRVVLLVYNQHQGQLIQYNTIQ